jgi:catechol 2,3-dioxygenase-like lactoylglutathione lyase family enzyme
MIDHMGMAVSDLARATEFYLKALAPLGYGIVMEVFSGRDRPRRGRGLRSTRQA